jgi:hypothetical protein
MNEKQKAYMKKQKTRVYEDLTTTFSLPVFEDEIAKDELPDPLNSLLVVYGDLKSTVITDSKSQLYQEVFVVFVSENNTEVEETTLDIITVVNRVPGFTFERTVKERLQKGETETFIDQVTLIFRRKLSYES